MPFQSTDHAKHFTTLFTFTQSYTEGRGCHARCRRVHQEQFGQGYLDMQPGELGDRTSGLPITEWPALPPEPQSPSTADYTEERYFLYWCHITRENRARRPNLSLTDDCKLELNINTIIFLIRSHHWCRYKDYVGKDHLKYLNESQKQFRKWHKLTVAFKTK